MIESAAAEVGVDYLDVAPHFAGHEICGNGKEWINATGIANNGYIDDESFHPKKRGQAEYAVVLNEWLQSTGPDSRLIRPPSELERASVAPARRGLVLVASEQLRRSVS